MLKPPPVPMGSVVTGASVLTSPSVVDRFRPDTLLQDGFSVVKQESDTTKLSRRELYAVGYDQSQGRRLWEVEARG
jgi:hypothetical protein